MICIEQTLAQYESKHGKAFAPVRDSCLSAAVEAANNEADLAKVVRALVEAYVD